MSFVTLNLELSIEYDGAVSSMAVNQSVCNVTRLNWQF